MVTRTKLLNIFVFSDMTTIRVQLAVASILFSIGTIPDRLTPTIGFDLFGYHISLLGPLHTFMRPNYLGMKELMPDWAWSISFLSHAIGVIWRFHDPVPRPWCAFIINAWGLSLWIVSTGLINAQVGEFTPGTGMEITMIVSAFLALIRTGLNDEKYTP